MSTGPTWQTIALVRERDQHACIRCGNQRDLSTQHRIARGMGGSSKQARPWMNRASNLITLCGSGTTGCHGWVETHPDQARHHGWAISRVSTLHIPEDVPVLYRDGWFLLDDLGGRYAVGGHASSWGGGGGAGVNDPHVGVPVPHGVAAPWPSGAPDLV